MTEEMIAPTQNDNESPEAKKQEPDDAIDAKEELNQLEASKTTESPKKAKIKNRAAAALTYMGALVLALSVPMLWASSLISNTDAWVAAVSPLAANPAIQEEVASVAATALCENLEIGRVVENQLPENLSFLAIPTASYIESFIHSEALDLVQSPQFYQTWTSLNKAAHAVLNEFAAGEKLTGILETSNGKIAIDLSSVGELLRDRITAKGHAFAENIPDISNDEQIVIADDAALANVQQVIGTLNQTSPFLLVIVILCFAGALFIAVDRRRAGLWVAAAAAIALCLVRLALALAQPNVVGAISPMGGEFGAAVSAAYGIVLSPLFAWLGWLTALAGVAWIALFLAGPSSIACRARGTTSRIREKVANQTN